MCELLPFLESLQAADAHALAAVRERHGVTRRASLALLADEIRLDGSNSFASLFRGYEGVEYREIVGDVAGKLGARVRAEDTLVEAEQALLVHVAQRYWEGLSDEERARVLDGIEGIPRDLDPSDFIPLLAGGGALAALLMREVVVKCVARLLAEMLAKVGVKEGAKHVARAATHVVPAIGVLMALWTVNDVAGPAYRKTIPTVIELALLRLQHGVGR